MTLTIEIKRIAEAALGAAENLLSDWLPDGTRKGNEYWPTNPVRGDRKPGSFSINMTTGKWHDFASGDKGGDLVSLLAYLNGCRQIDAARLIAQQLGIPFNSRHLKADPLLEATQHQRLDLQRQKRQQQDEIEKQAQWEQASARAQQLYHETKDANPAFPYLLRKGIKTNHFRQLDNKLVVPIYWRGAMVNLQLIAANGDKRFLSGGRSAGCYCPFGRFEDAAEIYITEGVATAATLYEQTGKPVAAAMSAGNLLAVGLELQRCYPDAALIIGADDDRAKEAEGKANTGKRTAIETADKLGCGYVLPAWPEGAPLYLSDFNDLHQWQEGRV